MPGSTQRYALVLLGLFPPAILELINGNIHLLLAAAIALGFRYPWTWSFVLLTKITPGIGLVWFGVRREWRQLGIALGATAAIAAVSFAIAPWMWQEWIDLLVAEAGKPAAPKAIPIPLTLRLPIALAHRDLGGTHRPSLDRARRGVPGHPRHVVVQQRDAAGHHPHPSDAAAGTCDDRGRAR